ncbi:MAG TPA: ABC transporter permease [Solirubrobacteraceae bacterium]|nr:ABC transporter permease [Solirubrobacteraceae bacterium]
MAAAPSSAGVPGTVALVLPEHAPAQAGGRLRRTLKISVPAGLLAVIFFLCFLGPLIFAVPGPTFTNILDANEPIFSAHHVLGTDQVGYDVWSRILYGGRTSLEIALAVNAIGLVVGGMFGAIAGYLGGIRDAVMMRIIDVLIAFPAIVLAIAIAERLGPSEFHVILALSVFSVPAFARLSRAATLRVREQTFITAARLSGTRTPRILLRHVVPNIIPQLTTFTLLGMGITVVLEGALSFLNLGIPSPQPSWGNMIASGQTVLTAEPRLVLVPSIALFITVLSLNLLGDGLREHWGSR